MGWGEGRSMVAMHARLARPPNSIRWPWIQSTKCKHVRQPTDVDNVTSIVDENVAIVAVLDVQQVGCQAVSSAAHHIVTLGL